MSIYTACIALFEVNAGAAVLNPAQGHGYMHELITTYHQISSPFSPKFDGSAIGRSV
jgi:hypothetical protein